MALSGSLTTNAYGGVRSLTLTWSATQSVSGNTSTVNWTLSGSGSTANYNTWYMTGPTKVVIDGTQVHYSTSRIQLRSGTVVASGSRTISHNSDGAKSFTIRIEGAIYTTSVNCTAEQSFTLNQIPRGATITSAPNFKDTDSPKMKFSNPAGGTMQVGIYKTDGSTALAAYRTATGSSYTFTFTSTEKANLQKVSTTSNTATVRFYLKSVVGGQTFVKSVDRTLTIASPAPTLSPTVVDGNSTTVALTGDRSKLVKYHSNARVTFGAAAVKGATLKSKKVTCATRALTADGTMQGVESGTFAFSVTDSRDNTTAKTVTKDMVNYVRLSCNLGDGMPDGEGTFALEVTGACFYGSFGAVDNTLAVEYRYRVQGAETWGTWTAVDSVLPLGFTYLARARVEGLDYQATYQFQARATDKLETVTTPEKTVKSLPTFDWSGKDFNFNVPVRARGYSLLGAAVAMTNPFDMDITVTKGANYSRATGSASLIGNQLLCFLNVTRKSATPVGNITNEEVCSIRVNHGGKIHLLYAVAFTTGATGGIGTLQVVDILNYDDYLTFSVDLAATTMAMTSFTARFVCPVTLNLDAFE